jgi:murein tripeptide amidase MpaA
MASTYLNTTEVDSAVRNLATAYPALSQLIELPEPSIEGTAIYALRLGSTAAKTDAKDCAVFIGGVHAREWGSCEILIDLTADLLEAYATGTGLSYGSTSFTSQDIRRVLDERCVVILPLVNPDGRHYSQTVDALWRKNRNPAQADGHLSRVGVDINRNFDFLFNFPTAFDPASGAQVSTDPASLVYEGPHAFSEPETRNVRWLLDAHPHARWFVDIHSYSQDMLVNWGDDENQSTDPDMNFRNHHYDGKRGVAHDTAYAEYIPKDDAKAAALLAQRFCDGVRGVRGTAYTPMSGFQLYPTSGTSDDYAYSRHYTDPAQGKILGFTIEWGKQEGSERASFHPPWTEMESIIKDVDAGLIQFCLATISP